VYNGLKENTWLQYIDGWAQLKGKEVFGKHYVEDEVAAHNMAGERLKTADAKIDADFFGKIHDHAFQQSAKDLDKKSAFRDKGNYIYLPLPTRKNVDLKQLYSGVKALSRPEDADVREVKPTKNHALSGQYQWSYKPKTSAEIKEMCNKFFNQFEQDVKAAGQDWDKILDAVVHLYSSLENIHPFLDGVGRTDQIVLNFYLSRVGLHPVSLYNTMESALSDEKDERQHILHGFYMWEQAYLQKKSPWTLETIQDKGKECMVLYQKLGYQPKKDPTKLNLKEALEPIKTGEATKQPAGGLGDKVRSIIEKFKAMKARLHPQSQSNVIAAVKASTLM